jgi:hypothetical protein
MRTREKPDTIRYAPDRIGLYSAPAWDMNYSRERKCTNTYTTSNPMRLNRLSVSQSLLFRSDNVIARRPRRP